MNGDKRALSPDDFLVAVAARRDDVRAAVQVRRHAAPGRQPGEGGGPVARGLEINRLDVGLGAALGVLLDEMGQLEEAAIINRAATLNFPDDPSLRLGYAHTLQRLGRAEEAMVEIATVRRNVSADAAGDHAGSDGAEAAGGSEVQLALQLRRGMQVYDISCAGGLC